MRKKMIRSMFCVLLSICMMFTMSGIGYAADADTDQVQADMESTEVITENEESANVEVITENEEGVDTEAVAENDEISEPEVNTEAESNADEGTSLDVAEAIEVTDEDSLQIEEETGSALDSNSPFEYIDEGNNFHFYAGEEKTLTYTFRDDYDISTFNKDGFVLREVYSGDWVVVPYAPNAVETDLCEISYTISGRNLILSFYPKFYFGKKSDSGYYKLYYNDEQIDYFRFNMYSTSSLYGSISTCFLYSGDTAQITLEFLNDSRTKSRVKMQFTDPDVQKYTSIDSSGKVTIGMVPDSASRIYTTIEASATDDEGKTLTWSTQVYLYPITYTLSVHTSKVTCDLSDYKTIVLYDFSCNNPNAKLTFAIQDTSIATVDTDILNIHPKKAGSTYLYFKLGKTILKKLPLEVIGSDYRLKLSCISTTVGGKASVSSQLYPVGNVQYLGCTLKSNAYCSLSDSGYLVGKKSGVAIKALVISYKADGVKKTRTYDVSVFEGKATMSSSYSINYGASKYIYPSFDGNGMYVKSASISDTAIATVKLTSKQNGVVVTARKVGTTYLTVTFSNGTKLKKTIKVTKGSVSMPTSKTVRKGGSVTISPTYSGVFKIKSVSSSNKAVATAAILSGSKTFKITGVKNGTATITVVFTSGLKRTISVTVKTTSVSTGSHMVPVGKTLTVTPTIVGGSTISKVSWDNGSICSVSLASDYKSFKVTGKTIGSTKMTILLKDGSKCTFTMTVTAVPTTGQLGVSWLTEYFDTTTGRYTVRVKVTNNSKYTITKVCLRIEGEYENGTDYDLDFDTSVNLAPGASTTIMYSPYLSQIYSGDRAICRSFSYKW